MRRQRWVIATCVEHQDIQASIGLLHLPDHVVVQRHKAFVIVVFGLRDRGAGGYNEIPCIGLDPMAGVIEQRYGTRRDRARKTPDGLFKVWFVGIDERTAAGYLESLLGQRTSYQIGIVLRCGKLSPYAVAAAADHQGNS